MGGCDPWACPVQQIATEKLSVSVASSFELIFSLNGLGCMLPSDNELYAAFDAGPVPLAGSVSLTEKASIIKEKQQEKDDKKQYSAIIIAYASNASASSVNSHKSIPPYISAQFHTMLHLSIMLIILFPKTDCFMSRPIAEVSLADLQFAI